MRDPLGRSSPQLNARLSPPTPARPPRFDWTERWGPGLVDPTPAVAVPSAWRHRAAGLPHPCWLAWLRRTDALGGGEAAGRQADSEIAREYQTMIDACPFEPGRFLSPGSQDRLDNPAGETDRATAPPDPARAIPATLDEWMALWRPAESSGNPTLSLGPDRYAVFPSRYGGWAASVGRSFAKKTWPTAEAAQTGLWTFLRKLSHEELRALHDGKK